MIWGRMVPFFAGEGEIYREEKLHKNCKKISQSMLLYEKSLEALVLRNASRLLTEKLTRILTA